MPTGTLGRHWHCGWRRKGFPRSQPVSVQQLFMPWPPWQFGGAERAWHVDKKAIGRLASGPPRLGPPNPWPTKMGEKRTLKSDGMEEESRKPWLIMDEGIKQS